MKNSCRMWWLGVLPVFLLTAYLMAQVFRVQTQTQVYDANGNLLASSSSSTQVSVPPVTQPVTPPVTQPVTPPVTQPTSGPIQYTTGIGEVIDAYGIPQESAVTNNTVASMLAAIGPRDQYDDLNPTPLIVPNAVWVSSALEADGKTPVPGYHAAAWTDSAGNPHPADLSTLSMGQTAAQATGVNQIFVRRGSVIAGGLAVSMTGSPTHWAMILGMGVNGWYDHSAPDPIMLSGIGFGTKFANNYVWTAGLNFSGTYTSSQTSALGFQDGWTSPTTPGPSGHLIFSDISVSGFATGISLAAPPGPGGSAGGTNIEGYNPDCFVVWHCHFHDLKGSRYAGYDDGITNLLVYGCTFHNIDAVCTAKDGTQMEHCWYTNMSQPRPAHPNVRFINDILATPESIGWKDCAGSLCDSCLFVGCPIDTMFDHYATVVHNIVSDGEDADLDPLQSAVSGSTTQTGNTGLTMSGGVVGVPGKCSGLERGFGLTTVTQPNFIVDGALFINKTSVVDFEPWFNLSTYQASGANAPNCIPDPVVVGTYSINNVTDHNFFQAQQNAVVAAPNTMNIDVSNHGSPTAQPTVTYSNCILPGVTGVSGVAGVEPTYANPNMDVHTYAVSLGLPDTMSFLKAAAANTTANYNPNLTAVAAINAIRAGFTHK